MVGGEKKRRKEERKEEYCPPHLALRNAPATLRFSRLQCDQLWTHFETLGKHLIDPAGTLCQLLLIHYMYDDIKRPDLLQDKVHGKLKGRRSITEIHCFNNATTHHNVFPGGAGVLPYIGYIGMYDPKGYGFSAV